MIDRRRNQGGVYHSVTCSPVFISHPSSSCSSFCRLSSSVRLQSDKCLGVGAVVDLDVDLGVFLTLGFLSPQPSAVAQQVTGQAESQHAQDQQPHIDPEWISFQRAHHGHEEGLLQ